MEKQDISIPLNAPMDTKVDEKLTSAEVFILHQNARFEKIGALKKRKGYEAVDPTALIVDNPNIVTTKVLSDSDSLIALTKPATRAPYAYREYNQTYALINYYDNNSGSDVSQSDTLNPVEVSGRIVASNSVGATHCDGDHIEGLSLFCYSGNSGVKSYVELHDSVSGTKIINSTELSTTGLICGRILQIANGDIYVVIAYIGSTFNTITVEVLDKNLVHVANGTVSGVPGLTFVMEKYTTDFKIVLGCCETTGSGVYHLVEINQTGIVQTHDFFQTATVKLTATSDLRIVGHVAYVAYVADLSGNDVIRLFSLNLSTGLQVNADRVVISTALDYTIATFDFITSAVIGVIGGVGNNGSSDPPQAVYVEHTIASSTSTTALIRFGITPYSRCRRLGTLGSADRTLICIGYDTPIQFLFSYATTSAFNVFNNSYILAFGAALLDEGGYCVVGKYNGGSTPIGDQGNIGVNLATLDNLNFYGTSLRVTSINDTTNSGEINSVYSIQINADPETYQKNSVAKLGRNFFVSSGVLSEYDGMVLMTNGFLHSAIIAAITQTPAGTSNIAPGTYSFIAIYEYVDSNGQIMRSAPSEAKSSTNASSIQSFNLTFPSYLGRKNTPSSKTNIVLYMTLNGGTTYYKAGAFASSTTAFLTSTVLTSIPSGNEEVLYTTGGILANDPPPPTKYVWTHQERLFSIDADYPNQISYTKKSAINRTAEWSDFFKLYLAASDVKRKNELVAGASLNEKNIIFRQSSIYYFLGDGPNNLGEQNNFTEPELIANDIGLLEQQSVISTPQGVLFKSVKGIYLLTPSLETKYIGAPVEEYNDEEILAAQLIEEDNLVFFKTADHILVYDYLLDRWNIDSVPGISLAVFNQKTVVLQEGNLISFESNDYADEFGEDTSSISRIVETGWIKTTGIQDFGRITYALILGKYISAHTLKVEVYYDFNETVANTYDLTHNVAQAVYQFRIQLKKQKCQSIKFKIYDVPVDNGESCELTNLTLELGIKQGPYKTEKSRNY